MADNEVIKKLKEHKNNLFKKYNIKSLGIFGSYARGEETYNSDVDVLVEYSVSPDFFEFLDLEDELSGLFNKRIDLVTEPALKPLIKDKILKETLFI